MLRFARSMWPVAFAAATTLVLAASTEARSHAAGLTVAAIVSRTLPAVVKVTLTDGRSFRGALLGADRFSDLAVVKIDGEKLPVLPDAAGFKPNDVVVAIAGRAVTDLHHFHDLLQQHRIGEPVDVTVWREGQTLTLRPVPEEYR